MHNKTKNELPKLVSNARYFQNSIVFVKIEFADVNMNLMTIVFNFLEILAASYIHAFHSVLCISSVDIIFLEVVCRV